MEDNDDNVESRLYDPVEDEFVAHVAGWNDRVEFDEDGEELEENRRVVTIARLSFFLSSFLWILLAKVPISSDK